MDDYDGVLWLLHLFNQTGNTLPSVMKQLVMMPLQESDNNNFRDFHHEINKKGDNTMKSLVNRSVALIMSLILCISLLSGLTVNAKTGSLTTNIGTRHEVCTALSPQAEAYYTGEYTYDMLSALQGGNESCLESADSELFYMLHELMTDTMTNLVTYNGKQDGLQVYWPSTDANDGSSVPVLFYSDYIGGKFNREHVWPKTCASFYQSDGGCDLHHLRPTDPDVNSTRSDNTMGNVRGKIHPYSTKFYNGQPVLYYDIRYSQNGCSGLVEVNDNIKGDIARIFLYVYVRWEERNLFENDPNPKQADNDKGGNNGLKVIESLETLLQWCENDPVDTWEMSRNDQTENVQGNRNVFIDYPEFAWLLFGQDIPDDMPTPSGAARDTDSKMPATVCFYENGTETGTLAGNAGETVTLPAHKNSVPSGYNFVGWVNSPLGSTSQMPICYAQGDSYILAENSTLYALYIKTADGTYMTTCAVNVSDPIANLPDGTYTIGARENNGYKVGIESGSTADGASAKLYAQDDSRGQKFVIRKNGDNSYTLRNVNSNLYLEVRNGGANGEYIATQCSYTGADAQRWIIRSKGDGSFTLQNKQSGKFLDLSAGEIYHSNQIQTWEYNGSSAQQWHIDPTDTLPDGTYTVRSASNTAFGWDIAGNSNDNGANLQLWSSDHKFVITHGVDGYYTIRALNSGRYVDVAGAGTDLGTNIHQYDGNGSVAQKWLVIPNPNGTYSFVSKNNSLYMDIAGGVIEDGSNIRCWEGNGSEAQAWVMKPVAILPDGAYTVRCFSDPAFGWDIQGASLDNNANLWAYDNRHPFVFTHDESGYYTIRSLASGRVLDVSYGGTYNGVGIVQYDDFGADNQKWLIVPNTDGSYSFVSKCNGKYIDLANNAAGNGTTINCWSPNGAPQQKWHLDLADLGIDGVYTVRSKVNENFGWDIQGSSKDNFGNLWSYENEYRFAIYREVDGYYTIRSLDSGKHLDVAGAGTAWGTNIQQYDGNGSDAQKWLIVPHTDGSYSFVSKANGLYIDLDNGAAANCTNIRCWGGNGSDAQRWTLRAKDSLQDGVYLVRSSVNTAFGWDIENASHDDGANLQIWESQHKFVITHNEDGYYTIKLLGSDKVLDVHNGLNADGVNIQQWQYNGSDAQKWRVLPNADGTWSFISVCNGKYIDLSGGNAHNSANIHCWSGNASNAQKWVLTPQN